MQKIKQNIFITGGAGYVGAILVPKLLANGHKVTVYDLFIFGKNVLKPHPNLSIVKGDIRNIDLLSKSIKKHDVFIHLACISNDPSFELNPKLGKSINLDCFEPMVKECKNNNVNFFIYASSSSVYGLKAEKNVHEDVSLDPLTDYSKYKAECEKILLKNQSEKFITTIIRPATVCGYSPRQRMDVVVNLLTNQAYHKKEISVLGGDQLRPNIHISDMADVYIKLLDTPKEKLAGKIFNAGYQNLSVKNIAETVQKVIGPNVKLKLVKSDDKRSYHISSEKIKNELGFIPNHTIEEAISDLKKALENGLLPNSLEDEKYFNIKRFENLNLKWS